MLSIEAGNYEGTYLDRLPVELVRYIYDIIFRERRAARKIARALTGLYHRSHLGPREGWIYNESTRNLLDAWHRYRMTMMQRKTERIIRELRAQEVRRVERLRLGLSPWN